jgi:hypothetical protein
MMRMMEMMKYEQEVSQATSSVSKGLRNTRCDELFDRKMATNERKIYHFEK